MRQQEWQKRIIRVVNNIDGLCYEEHDNLLIIHNDQHSRDRCAETSRWITSFTGGKFPRWKFNERTTPPFVSYKDNLYLRLTLMHEHLLSTGEIQDDFTIRDLGVRLKPLRFKSTVLNQKRYHYCQISHNPHLA